MKKEPTLKLYVSYSQVSVFVQGLDNPFNDWSPQQVEQGFAWRKESVSFKTIEEDGEIFIYVSVSHEFTPQPESQRIIRVPFEVPESCMIEIASITDGQAINVPSGNYSLYFETNLNRENQMIGHFTFCRKHLIAPKIVKQDSEVKEPKTYIMEAKSA